LPDVRSFTNIELITGRPYRFYLVAFNYAGQSEASPIETIYACADPGSIQPPKLNGYQTTVVIPLIWT
jgi:hypothetical protein